MMPTLPSPTAATRSVNPIRPAGLAADRARSSSITVICCSLQPSSAACRRSSYCRASDSVFSRVWAAWTAGRIHDRVAGPVRGGDLLARVTRRAPVGTALLTVRTARWPSPASTLRAIMRRQQRQHPQPGPVPAACPSPGVPARRPSITGQAGGSALSSTHAWVHLSRSRGAIRDEVNLLLFDGQARATRDKPAPPPPAAPAPPAPLRPPRRTTRPSAAPARIPGSSSTAKPSAALTPRRCSASWRTPSAHTPHARRASSSSATARSRCRRARPSSHPPHAAGRLAARAVTGPPRPGRPAPRPAPAAAAGHRHPAPSPGPPPPPPEHVRRRRRDRARRRRPEAHHQVKHPIAAA